MIEFLRNLYLHYQKKIILFLVLVVLIYFIAKNYDDFFTNINKINWIMVVFSSLTHLLAIIMQIFGWYFLASKISKDKNFLIHSSIYASSFVSRRIPLGIIWNISSRFLQYKNYFSKKQLSLLVFCEHILIGGAGGLLVFFILLINQYLVPNSLRIVLVAISFILVVFLAGIVLFNSASRSLPHYIEKIANNFSLFSLKTLLSSFLFFLTTWILDGLSLYLLLISLDINNSLPFTLGISWLSTFVSFWGQFLPFYVAYKELILTLLLSKLSPITTSIFVAIFQRVIHTLTEVILAIILDKLNKCDITQR
ncbi:MAG: lysylphosphatidylglycerol synthase domain-containing protein [Caldanaerobacter sp.]